MRIIPLLALNNLILPFILVIFIMNPMIAPTHASYQNYPFQSHSKPRVTFFNLLNGDDDYTPHILYPKNGTAINYSPIPFLVTPFQLNSSLWDSKSNISSIELRVNQENWQNLSKNNNSWVYVSNISKPWDPGTSKYWKTGEFWFLWLSVKSKDGKCIIEFREDETKIWQQHLELNISLSSIPKLDTNNISLNYHFKITGLIAPSDAKDYLYTYDSKDSIFSAERGDSEDPKKVISSQKLATSEKNSLMGAIQELWNMKSNLSGVNVFQECCPEYYERWTITIVSGGTKKTISYWHRFQPPIFQECVQDVEDLADTVISESTKSSQMITIGVIPTLVSITIFFFWRRKRRAYSNKNKLF